MSADARVWDRFLTPDDQAVLAVGWAKAAPFGLGERPAVLVVDNSASSLGDRGTDTVDVVTRDLVRLGRDGWSAIDHTVELLTAARSAAVPVVFTVIRPERWGMHRHDRFWQAATAPGSTDVLAELEPGVNELVLEKAGSSAFFGTNSSCTSISIESTRC